MTNIRQTTPNKKAKVNTYTDYHSFGIMLIYDRDKDQELRNEITLTLCFWTVQVQFNFLTK